MPATASADDDDDPSECSTLGWILRELPRRKLALLVLLALLNVGRVTATRGFELAHPHGRVHRLRIRPRAYIQGVEVVSTGVIPVLNPVVLALQNQRTFVPPWEWGAADWRETVLPGP